MSEEPKKIVQCKTCPWRVDCEPMTDIPNYRPELHHGLDDTIAEPGSLCGLGAKTMRVMACHYAKPGEEFPCAGWLHNQIGPGNNIAVRLRVMVGQMPVPVVDGEQHETFEETLCNVPRRTATATFKASSTSSTRRRATTSGRSSAGKRSSATSGASASSKTRRRASTASRSK